MKKIRRRTRNRIIGVGSTLVVLVLGIMLVTGMIKADYSSKQFHDDLMGEAKEYGLVADSIHQWYYHMGTNFATNKYSTSGFWDNGKLIPQTFTTGQYSSGGYSDTIAVKVADGSKLWATGTDGVLPTIYTAEDLTKDANKNKFKFQGSDDYYYNHMIVKQDSSTVLSKKVDDMLSHVRGKSQELGKKKSDDYTVAIENNVVKIDASRCSKFVYIDAYDPQFFDYSKGKVWGIVDRCRTIYIKKNPKIDDQVFVLNYARYDGEETPSPTVEPTDEPTTEPTQEPANVQSANAVADPTDNPTNEGGEGTLTAPLPAQGNDPETTVEESTEEPSSEPETEKNVSLLGLPREARAAEHIYKYDINNSKKVEVQLARVWFVNDNWQPIQLDQNSASAVEDFSQRVIYNLPYASKVWANQTIGTILAPEADSKFGGNDDNDQSNRANCSGWFVTKKIESNCGEWHFFRTPPTTEPPSTTEPVVTTEPPVETTEPPVVTTEPPVVTTEPPVVTTEPPVVTTEPPVVTTEPPVVTTEPPVVTTEPPVVTTEPPVVTTEPPVVTTEPPVVTTQPPVTTPPVVTTQPPTNTPPTTYTNPPSNTPPVVYYTFSPSPTETPTTVVEEEVPLSDFTPEEKPKEETTTIVEDVPLAATVPETGDTMNPMVPIAGMGLSLLAIVGVVVIRKKKSTK